MLNTINFKKSMHYNPFAYLRSEKDILKLVNTLIVNTKGAGLTEMETDDIGGVVHLHGEAAVLLVVGLAFILKIAGFMSGRGEWTGTASELIGLVPDIGMKANTLTRKLNVNVSSLFNDFPPPRRART